LEGPKGRVGFKLLDEEIGRIGFTRNMKNGYLIKKTCLPCSILPNVDMSHALHAKRVRPVHGTMIVVVHRYGTSCIKKLKVRE